jgi:hypothetical protein
VTKECFGGLGNSEERGRLIWNWKPLLPVLPVNVRIHDSVRPLETRRNDRGSHGCALRGLQNSIVLPILSILRVFTTVSADIALIAGRSGALGLRLNCKDGATKQVKFSRMWRHVMTPSLIDHERTRHFHFRMLMQYISSSVLPRHRASRHAHQRVLHESPMISVKIDRTLANNSPPGEAIHS